MESGLYSYLISNAGVIAVLGDRLYPVVVPESPTFPVAAFSVLSKVPVYTADGNSGFINYRVQFDTYGNTYADAKAVQFAITTAIDSYTGTLPDGTVVGNVMQVSARDLYDSDARVYRTLSDFIIQTQQ